MGQASPCQPGVHWHIRPCANMPSSPLCRFCAPPSPRPDVKGSLVLSRGGAGPDVASGGVGDESFKGTQGSGDSSGKPQFPHSLQGSLLSQQAMRTVPGPTRHCSSRSPPLRPAGRPSRPALGVNAFSLSTLHDHGLSRLRRARA